MDIIASNIRRIASAVMAARLSPRCCRRPRSPCSGAQPPSLPSSLFMPISTARASPLTRLAFHTGSLGDNELGAEGGKALGAALAVNTTLKSVEYAPRSLALFGSCQQPLTARFGPCSQSPRKHRWQRRCQGARRGPQDELHPPEHQVSGPTPRPLLSVATDIAIAALFAVSASTSSERGVQSTSPTCSK